jgi:2-polyprenyl-6-methoxyphenol hydroxylase-like FAD-dependent oxidoreductase
MTGHAVVVAGGGPTGLMLAGELDPLGDHEVHKTVKFMRQPDSPE